MNRFTKGCKKVLNKFLDIIFPENTKCIFCKDEIANFSEKPYCEKCEATSFNTGNKCIKCDTHIKEGNIICDHCKSKPRKFEKCLCPLNYSGGVRSSIISFKDSNAKYLAKSYAKIIFKYLKDKNLDFDYITFVPSHAKTIKRRGYNPSEILAKELSVLYNKPCIKTLLKTSPTQQQKNLTFEERTQNLKDSMIVTNSKLIKGKNLLLVDDVITTCATINYCSRLLSTYANKIFATAIARNHLETEKMF